MYLMCIIYRRVIETSILFKYFIEIIAVYRRSQRRTKYLYNVYT